MTFPRRGQDGDQPTIRATLALLWEAACVRASHFWLRRALAAKERRLAATGGEDWT